MPWLPDHQTTVWGVYIHVHVYVLSVCVCVHMCALIYVCACVCVKFPNSAKTSDHNGSHGIAVRSQGLTTHHVCDLMCNVCEKLYLGLLRVGEVVVDDSMFSECDEAPVLLSSS